MTDDAGLGIVAADVTRVTLAVGKDGYPGLSLAGDKRNSGVLLGLDGQDSPTLLLRDERGRLVARARDLKLDDASGAVLYSAPPTK